MKAQDLITVLYNAEIDRATKNNDELSGNLLNVMLNDALVELEEISKHEKLVGFSYSPVAGMEFRFEQAVFGVAPPTAVTGDDWVSIEHLTFHAGLIAMVLCRTLPYHLQGLKALFTTLLLTEYQESLGAFTAIYELDNDNADLYMSDEPPGSCFNNAARLSLDIKGTEKEPRLILTSPMSTSMTAVYNLTLSTTLKVNDPQLH